MRHVILSRMQALAACIFALGQPVYSAELNICWTGANGYTLNGRMSVPDAAMRQDIVTETDVTRFKISGYHNGRLLGTWDMRDARADTTWFLRFDPRSMTFPTGGTFATHNSQGWNANGGVSDCGTPGFGFNSGGYAQDVCVNGTYIRDSSVAPDTPLVATTAPVQPDCTSVAPLSKSAVRNHFD